MTFLHYPEELGYQDESTLGKLPVGAHLAKAVIRRIHHDSLGRREFGPPPAWSANSYRDFNLQSLPRCGEPYLWVSLL